MDNQYAEHCFLSIATGDNSAGSALSLSCIISLRRINRRISYDLSTFKSFQGDVPAASRAVSVCSPKGIKYTGLTVKALSTQGFQRTH